MFSFCISARICVNVSNLHPAIGQLATKQMLPVRLGVADLYSLWQISMTARIHSMCLCKCGSCPAEAVKLRKPSQ